ncbi:helix-turn-helix domain-containing protein [Nesterenkonia rhizosphaerae]|uniref:HTH araC/xylS-type domain-containing protein n=1 Tax=Nesterenkonia rhizosphaerae TaxID=1348272 RepID=A0ABP9FP94_9MICC
MNKPHQDSAVLSRTTTAVGLLAWRTTISETVVPLEIREEGGKPFKGRLRRAAVDRVGLFDMRTTPHSVHRWPHLISDAQPRFYKMSLLLSGRAVLEQDGRTAILEPGDLAVYDTHRPYTLTFPDVSRAMVMIFPQEMVELTAQEMSSVTAVRFCGREGFARMISPFLSELSRNLDQLCGEYASRLVHSALDLMVTMLAQELRRQDEAQSGSGRSLARSIRQYILNRLGDDSLTPSSIAEAHFISLRYLYTLFSDDGQTVSAWIRAQRLAHIRRDLADPLYADKPVSWIAGRWGLHDAAHFSRLFKAEHGESPTAYRRRHLEGARMLASTY